MPTLKLNDAEIYFQELGQGEPIVMLHGLLLGNMATWYFGAASALAKSMRVVLYDLRGHGMSSKATEGYSLSNMVEDLRQLLDAQGIERTALVGHSYGALVSLHFALRYPERVSKLVMVEGPLPPARGTQMEEFLGLSEADQIEALPADLQEMIGKNSRQTRKLLERLQFLTSETALLANLRAERDVSSEELRALDVPTLLLYGTESQLSDVGERLRDHLGQAQLHWIQGGHYLPSERPAELSQRIGEFFA